VPTTFLVVQLNGGALVFQSDVLVSSWNFQQAAIVFISSCLQLPLFHSHQLMHMYGTDWGQQFQFPHEVNSGVQREDKSARNHGQSLSNYMVE